MGQVHRHGATAAPPEQEQHRVIVTCNARTAASDAEVVANVADVLDRRSAQRHPAVTLTVTDPVALGIAALLRGPTPSGQVLERFYRSGRADSAELIEAARTEQAFAGPEAHAALHCLIGWVRGRVHRLKTSRD
jgi:hypothetical protein